jgi:rhodanese-related sulfurtransferase
MAGVDSSDSVTVPEIEARDAAKAHATGSAVFVDVREPDEWAEGHIPGALHIPLADLPQRASELPADADLILVCRSGGRSFVATEFLVRTGYPRVANMVGGMLAWEDARYPVAR